MDEGSSPTPGASNGGSKGNNIYVKSQVISEKIFYKKEMTLQNSQISTKGVISDSSKYVELERKLDSITNGLSKPYFKKILRVIAKESRKCQYYLRLYYCRTNRNKYKKFYKRRKN